jgi:hypothetical protein
MQMPMLFQWLVPHWWRSETPKAPDEESVLSKVMNTSVGKAPGAWRCVAIVEFHSVHNMSHVQQVMLGLGLDHDNEIQHIQFLQVRDGENKTIQF